ncbi:MAG: biopolymer transporter ExbD [Armatimonadetes bacterium]|nr:biopolymer transporter ExbD [Armatimonadota bacterium]
MMISHGGKKRRHSVMAEINITPFTDVVLVLMIIFMVSASFVGVSNALNVNLPTAKAAEPLQKKQDVDIVVQPSGHVLLNGNRIAVRDLAGTLKAMHRETPVDQVIVRADRSVVWERVVQVMDAAKQAGLVNIALPTEVAQPDRR